MLITNFQYTECKEKNCCENNFVGTSELFDISKRMQSLNLESVTTVIGFINKIINSFGIHYQINEQTEWAILSVTHFAFHSPICNERPTRDVQKYNFRLKTPL